MHIFSDKELASSNMISESYMSETEGTVTGTVEPSIPEVPEEAELEQGELFCNSINLRARGRCDPQKYFYCIFQ